MRSFKAAGALEVNRSGGSQIRSMWQSAEMKSYFIGTPLGADLAPVAAMRANPTKPSMHALIELQDGAVRILEETGQYFATALLPIRDGVGLVRRNDHLHARL